MRVGIWIGIGIVTFALVTWGRRSMLTDTSASIARMAQAIARAEGFNVPGSIPNRANNPGNLKLGGQTINGITVYTTAAAGWAALERQLTLIVDGASAHYSLNTTIRQMGETWAPSGDRNVPGAWARNVAAALGVTVDTPLRAVLA